MSHRFDGPPPCNKLHCEWLYSNSKQMAKEIIALKQRASDLAEQLQASKEAQRHSDQLRMRAEKELAEAKKSQHASEETAATRVNDAARASAAAASVEVARLVALLKRRDADIAALRQTESPRSLERHKMNLALREQLGESKRILMAMKTTHESTVSTLRRVGHATSAVLCRVAPAPGGLDPEGDNLDDADGIIRRISRLDAWAKMAHMEVMRLREAHANSSKRASGLQTALEMAKADLESAAAAASEEAARRSDAEGRLMSLQGQVTNLRSTVEQELEAALRESTHREAVVEKRLLAATLEVNSLQEALGHANRIAEQRATDLKEQSIKLGLAEKRAMSMHQVFETVMAAKNDEKASTIQALQAKEKLATEERTRLRAQLAEKAEALARVTSQLTSARSALDAANSRAARHARVNSVATTPGSMLLHTPAPVAAGGKPGGHSPGDTAAETVPVPRRDPVEWSRAHQALERSASLQPEAMPTVGVNGGASEALSTSSGGRSDTNTRTAARASGRTNDGRRSRPSPLLDRTRSPLKMQGSPEVDRKTQGRRSSANAASGSRQRNSGRSGPVRSGSATTSRQRRRSSGKS